MHRQDELNMMFEAIDEEGREFVIEVLQGEFKRVCKLRRSRLRLIDCTQLASNSLHNQVNALPVIRTS